MAYVRLKCHLCDTDFGQEIRFVDHLVCKHNIEIEKHEDLYVEIHFGGKYPTCNCSIECDIKLPWVGWKKGFVSKYARGHNARIDSVYHDKERQKEFAKKRIEGLSTGRFQPWNKGLSKETDDRVAKQAISISRGLENYYYDNKPWQIGLTKETDERIKRLAENRNKALLDGRIRVWNKGKTKNSDKRLAALSSKLSEIKQICDPRRLTQDELALRIEKSDVFTLITDVCNYKNKYQLLELQCKTCGTKQQKNLTMLKQTPVCFSCHPKGSQGEREILEFIRSLGVDAISCDRSVIAPKELDIYIPEHKLAIEFNGLYWHSSILKTDQRYHQNKVDACSKVGINLFSVYEDEWREKRVLIETMIKHRLSIISNKHYARKLSVVELSKAQAVQFFESNHLEGHVRSTIAYGLVDTDNMLYAAMSLRQPFHKQYSDVYEVARSCIAQNTNVIGWIGKLTSACLKYAKAHGKRGLMTYVDNRVGLGAGYEKAGWSLKKSDTNPRFWWTDFVRRYNRFKIKADSANDITQNQAASEAGVVPIWGCSNSLYEFL